ncbi:hypothetical protein ALI144C_36355 [Actinosynnema sp. ALI-1.44]|uniref:phosphopantetheine-binding protein n=1 Tax=Actinosynnema sp. ALI-1.44 TaxID=1933779 RepID=UPI00097C82F2|nr:phosphopantetheine-binding protein [Actinosynnema sp. ALI-1.44]ONI76152.1 hypothetical protein ALI144C_36355 [Actinosynnema sp. ALI-1.44]
MTGTLAATEATLCRILAEVLELDLVHPQDSFFEVGGDSVLALQVVARAREAGLVFGVRDLFDHQTAATLAMVAGELPAPVGGFADAGEEPLVTFEDGDFGDFGEFEEAGASASGAEADWETSK